MYSTVWCGYCQRLKAQMTRAGIEYTEVDIEADTESAAFVASVNGGNEVVPTLKFADGTTLTNPPIADVIAKMAL
jgi:mycoredoxin